MKKRNSLIKIFITTFLFCFLCYLLMMNVSGKILTFFVVLETAIMVVCATSFETIQKLSYSSNEERSLFSRFSYVALICADVLLMKILIPYSVTMIRLITLIVLMLFFGVFKLFQTKK